MQKKVYLRAHPTGGNLVAAVKKAKELGPGRTVVTLIVDSGMKYLSTALYKDVADEMPARRNMIRPVGSADISHRHTNNTRNNRQVVL